MAELFKGWIEQHEYFELMAPVNVSLVCFRLNDGRNEEELNELNQQLMESINQTGKVFLTHTTLRGKYVLRMAIAQRTTEERHVKAAWDLVVSKAKELRKKNEI